MQIQMLLVMHLHVAWDPLYREGRSKQFVSASVAMREAGVENNQRQLTAAFDCYGTV